jgi:hypothetical protein
MSRSQKAMLACFLASLAVLPSVGRAEHPRAPNTDSRTQSNTDEKRRALITEATSAIQETQSALKQLDDDKPRDALAALERATGKLDVILARDPQLELAPAAVSVVTYDVEGGVEAVNKVRKQAEDLVDAGRLQEARHLLKGLASETVVSVTNLPLGTFPEAIKSAVKLIDQKKFDAAKHVLQAALNTQVVTDTIIPLPVVRAQEYLKTAESLAERKDRNKDDNDHLKLALDQAAGQIQFAQALGYGTKKDFDGLDKQLAEIRDKTADNKFGTGFFAKIKASIGDLMKSNQSKSG